MQSAVIIVSVSLVLLSSVAILASFWWGFKLGSRVLKAQMENDAGWIDPLINDTAGKFKAYAPGKEETEDKPPVW
jgi:hypothetical protein